MPQVRPVCLYLSQTILQQAEIMFVVEVIDIVPKGADDVVILLPCNGPMVLGCQ